MCEALTFLWYNIYIRFGTKLCRQIVGISMGTKCAPHVADLFCFAMNRFLGIRKLKLLKLSIQYLDIWMTCFIDNTYFDGMVHNVQSNLRIRTSIK